ncbi:MAG: hypothetical protein NZM27_00040 [Acetobacteraceae bacterium]|nr:hypothetical protein [Acetobacteraceae bacterium]MDW8398911.1 hypothetical protein [Acetobacteraceae bacterium]
MDIQKVYFAPANFEPPGNFGRSRSINFDGLLLTDEISGRNDKRFAFVQLCRDGALEVVRGEITVKDHRPPHPACFVAKRVQEMVDALPRFLAGLSSLGLPGPFATVLSVLGVEGSQLDEECGSYSFPPKLCHRPDLLLPLALIEDPHDTAQVFRRLRAPLDALWNAFGYLRCPWYDDNGDWRGSSG